MLDTIEAKIKQIQSGNYIISRRFEKLSFNPTIGNEDIQDFEDANDVILPQGYKEFIRTIGNGGAAPGSGLLPLDSGSSCVDPRIISEEGRDRISLAEGFPYREAWNDASYYDALETGDSNVDVLRGGYFSTDHIKGSICICDLGCGDLLLLVVKGEEAGNVWYDGRGNYSGIFPYSYKEKERVGFLEWYDIWLTEILNAVPLVEREF